MADSQHSSVTKQQPKETAQKARDAQPKEEQQNEALTAEIGAPRPSIDSRGNSPENILALQGLIGNRAVSRLIQRKLVVGAAHDSYEQEADRVSELVTEKSAPSSVQRQEHEDEIQTKPLAASITPLVQRQEDEDEIQTKPLAASITPLVQRQEDEDEIQTARQNMMGSFEANEDFESRLSATRGGGTPLPDDVRKPMEKGMGADFSGVRVHTGGESAQLNRAVSAQAFTHGADIYLGEGKSDLQSNDGQKLIAHELTHVVQQTGRTPLADDSSANIARTTKPSDGAPMVQRVPEDAVLIRAGGASLHKSKKGKSGQPDKVRSGGIFGTGLKKKVPKGATLQVDYERKSGDNQYIWGEFRGTSGYMNKANVGIRIGTTRMYLKQAAAWCIYNEEKNSFLAEDLTETEARQIASVIPRLELTQTTKNIQIENLEGLVKGILENRNQAGAETDLTPEAKAGRVEQSTNMWKGIGIQKFEDTVLVRVKADKPKLVERKLITAAHELKSVKFSGSDFHKGGQQVVFLGYAKPDGSDPRRVVYKPSSLVMDRQLLGKKVELSDPTSAAELLDPTGTSIANYVLVPITNTAGADQGYGYMEFVKGEGPADATDVMGIYTSIAANMAFSYLMGLDDIHQENIILRKNRLQIIDMEATTGTFNLTNAEGIKGGFNDQQWNKAFGVGMTMLLDGLFKTIEEGIKGGTLRELPKTGDIEAVMLSQFNAIIARAEDPAKAGEWTTLETGLKNTRTRIVPIQTKSFYGLRDRVKRENLDYVSWCAQVDADNTNGQNAILMSAREGQTSTTDDSLRNILKSPGTYNALARGDIPYYVRDLGSSNIVDEEGHPIAATGHSKVGQPIDVEIQGRRTAQNRTRLLEIFKLQGVQQVKLGNDHLTGTLTFKLSQGTKK